MTPYRRATAVSHTCVRKRSSSTWSHSSMPCSVRGAKGSAAASHAGSARRSIRRLATIGFTAESEGCQISDSSSAWLSAMPLLRLPWLMAACCCRPESAALPHCCCCCCICACCCSCCCCCTPRSITRASCWSPNTSPPLSGFPGAALPGVWLPPGVPPCARCPVPVLSVLPSAPCTTAGCPAALPHAAADVLLCW